MARDGDPDGQELARLPRMKRLAIHTAKIEGCDEVAFRFDPKTKALRPVKRDI